MPEIIIPGPEGRLEARYQKGNQDNSPLCVVLHPHPRQGGTMNNKLVYRTYQAFKNSNFSTLRFNFRGVGRSQGTYDNGIGELTDAAAALDWLQAENPTARTTWIAGFSFGAWLALQLLMRRPEITGFVAISPPASLYDFSFLAPCPSNGIIIIDNMLWHGDVADTKKTDSQTNTIRDLNLKINQDDRVEFSLLPLSDGLSFVRKK